MAINEEAFQKALLSSLRDLSKLKIFLESNDSLKNMKEIINSIQDEEGSYILSSAIEQNEGKGSSNTIGEVSDSNQEIGVPNTKAIVNILIQYGANVNARDKIGSPLFRAIYYECEEVALLLIKAKADVNVMIVQGEGLICETLLDMAIRRKQHRVIYSLIEAGANIGPVSNDGHTASHLAIPNKLK